jgi:hypothetical protein
LAQSAPRVEELLKKNNCLENYFVM